MGKIMRKGIAYGGSSNKAKSIIYDNSNSELEATNVQDAITELGDQLSSEIADQQERVDGLTLGIASDGLIYLFVDGNPVGTGIPRGQSADVYGYIDENNNLVLEGLSEENGTYTASYKMADGTLVGIGELSFVEESGGYTNLADPSSSDWVVGKRFNSAGDLVDVDSGVNGATTNYIGGDFVAGDIIRVKNMDLTTYMVVVYDSAKASKVITPLNNAALASYVSNVSVSSSEASFTINADTHLTSGGYIRFCGPLIGTSEDVIITKNEEIA